MLTRENRPKRIGRAIAASLLVLCAIAIVAPHAGAQPPPPTCGPSCPTPVIVFNPAGGTDTLQNQIETIDICGAGGGDSAAFNGTPITSQFTWSTSSCSHSVPNGVQNGQSGTGYTLLVGTNTFYVHACNNAVPKVCTSGSATITHPALGVNPKLKTVNVTERSIVTQKFTVSNYTASSQTYTLTVTCTSTVTNCSASPYPSIPVNSGSQGTVTVTYTSGAVNTSGTVQLKAVDPAGHADSAAMTVNAINALTVSTAFMNQDDQDMMRCAVSCFAAATALSTVPIISKGLPQAVSLVYHGDRVAVRPFLYMDVTAGPSTPAITDLELTAQYQVNGNWIAMTFVNGDATLHFAGSQLNAKPDTAFRLGAQVDASSLANTAWAAAPLKITLVAVYSDHQEFYTDSSQTLSVVSEHASPIAAGWSVAGVPHLYGRSDGSASQIVVKEGNGSTTMYNGNNCVPNCIWMPTGPGVFSRIDYLYGAPDSMVYIRSYPDSTREYFYGSRINSGAIGRRVDRFQDTVLFVYDTLSRLIAITDPYRTANGVHLVWQIRYGPNGIDSIIEPLTAGLSNARRTTDSVDANHLLRKWTDPDGVSTTFGYDADKRLTSITGRNGNTTTFVYDTLWKLATVTSPLVPIDQQGNGDTASVQLVTTYQDWQEAGVPWKPTSQASQWQPARTDTIRGIATPSGQIHVIQPDRWGQALVTVDPLGDTTRFARDGNGMPLRITYPTGAMDQFQYSGPLLISSTPAYQSVTTNYHYGAFALADSVYGAGILTTYNYFTVAGRGRIDSTRVGAGNPATAYTYDSFFRATKVVDPLGHTTVMGYDPVSGSPDSAQAMPSQRYSKTIFDHVGRDSIDIVTGFHLLQTTSKFYDAMNRVVKAWDGVHPDTLKFHYDALYLDSLTDMKGQTYHTTHNALGWLMTQTDPANRTTSTTYNILGLPATVTNKRNQQIQYTYDAIGRLKTVHRPGNRSHEGDVADTITYSPKGDIVTAYDSVVRDVTYYSDASNWVDSTITTFVPHNVWWKRYYHHNALGQVDSIAFSTNGTAPLHTRYFYWDAQSGLLDSLLAAGSGASRATHLGYSPEFIHDTTNYPSITRIDSIDDIHGLLASSYSSQASGTFNRNYAYDSTGRIAEVDFPDGTSELYDYNALGQLIGRSIGAWTDTIPCSKSHGFDGYPCGDTTKFSATQRYGFGFDLAASFDTLNDITHNIKTLGMFGAGNTDSLWNAVSITHDNDGNRSANGSAAQYVWGADGRLLQVVVGSNTINYDYDVSGQLVRRQLNGVDDKYYLWDNGQLVGILNHSAQSDSIEYAYFPGTDQPFFQWGPGSSSGYFEQDASGNVIGLHCCNEVSQSLRYDPWGNLESATTVFGDTTLLRWKGLLWESGPQLYYVRARWYDPVTRRFLSPDPMGLSAGINQYAFAGGDPINGSDPTGMLCADPDNGGDCPLEGGMGGGWGGTGGTWTAGTSLQESLGDATCSLNLPCSNSDILAGMAATCGGFGIFCSLVNQAINELNHTPDSLCQSYGSAAASQLSSGQLLYASNQNDAGFVRVITWPPAPFQRRSGNRVLWHSPITLGPSAFDSPLDTYEILAHEEAHVSLGLPDNVPYSNDANNPAVAESERCAGIYNATHTPLQ